MLARATVPPVCADQIPEHAIGRPVHVIDGDAVAAVAGSKVPRQGVRVGPGADQDSGTVAQRGGARGVGADIVALHHVPGGIASLQDNAFPTARRDDVACAGSGPPIWLLGALTRTP